MKTTEENKDNLASDADLGLPYSLEEILEKLRGRELFPESNRKAREMLKNMKFPEDLFDDKNDRTK